MRRLVGISLILASQGPAILAQPPAVSSYDIVTDGGRKAGTVSLTEAPKGLLIRVEAAGLTPGWHGMHIHSVATCADPGFKASGGHVHDASSTSVHGLLNANETDLGDLPNIYAGPDGKAAAEVLAPNVSLGTADGRLNLLDTDGSALVIHASPDDHSSQPIGGAGARVACAAIK
ncbi:superoxide dismutase family protein [Sphingomonas alba]|uniref:Superoxide dismutase [Cu-Zn] n=1 Tax=Sphingomonas alba TaxID=2908208 RepID=A0ABT0RPA3_9SPHN|nr:superoxide dismutase family protein [Sphingomonas alba]MCL6684484.1 superoxide dismutase family protein [Sphingomonas alba]